MVITKAVSHLYKREGDDAFVNRMAANGLSAKALARTPGKWVIMVRLSLIRDFEPALVTPTPEDAWGYAVWCGCLRNEDGQKLQAWFDNGGATAKHLHTCGHASPSDLRLRQCDEVEGQSADSRRGLGL